MAVLVILKSSTTTLFMDLKTQISILVVLPTMKKMEHRLFRWFTLQKITLIFTMSGSCKLVVVTNLIHLNAGARLINLHGNERHGVINQDASYFEAWISYLF